MTHDRISKSPEYWKSGEEIGKTLLFIDQRVRPMGEDIISKSSTRSNDDPKLIRLREIYRNIIEQRDIVASENKNIINILENVSCPGPDVYKTYVYKNNKCVVYV